jgi:hypothetical protein
MLFSRSLAIWASYLTRIRMVTLLSWEKDPLGGYIWGQKSIWSKIDTGRMLMTPGIHLRQNNLILTSIWGSYGGQSSAGNWRRLFLQAVTPSDSLKFMYFDVSELPDSQAFQQGAIRPLSIFEYIDLWPPVWIPMCHFSDLKTFLDFWLRIGPECQISRK